MIMSPSMGDAMPVFLMVVLGAFFLARPLAIIILPDDICGPGGWLIDTDRDVGTGESCDGDSD